MPAQDEQQVVLQARSGSHDAFRVLVERYMKQAYNVAYGFVNDHDDANDIVQESFVRAYQSIGSFRGEAQFSTWLYRIVTNVSLNRTKQKTKKMAREETHPEVLLELGHYPLPAEDSDLAMHIERAVHQLPTLQRAVVILRHINGLSTREVSSILKCSEGTIKTHLYRGLKKMKKKLQFLRDE